MTRPLMENGWRREYGKKLSTVQFKIKDAKNADASQKFLHGNFLNLCARLSVSGGGRVCWLPFITDAEAVCRAAHKLPVFEWFQGA